MRPRCHCVPSTVLLCKEKELNQRHDFERQQVDKHRLGRVVRLHLQQVGLAEREDGGGEDRQQLDRVVRQYPVPQQQHLLAGQVAGESAHQPLESQPQRLNADRLEVKEQSGFVGLEQGLKQETERDDALGVGGQRVQLVEVAGVDGAEDEVERRGVVVDVAQRRGVHRKPVERNDAVRRVEDLQRQQPTDRKAE